eukprot:10845226-Lingulodinium_polyedra.AAC.1
MPRTPAVFEEKTSWNLDPVDGDGVREADNYRSVEGHIREVENLFRAEEALGWMVEMSNEDAVKAYGQKLYVASLAVVVEPKKLRVVHDGTNT